MMGTVGRSATRALRWLPHLFLALLLASFGMASPRFLSTDNLTAILAQSSWLLVVALGMNFVLLTGGVDLSVGATMYVAAVGIALGLEAAPLWLCLTAAPVIGAALGALNGFLIVRFGLPAFIATLGTIFLGRGLGLYLSSTQIVFASSDVAHLGRTKFIGISVLLVFTAVAVVLAWLVLRFMPLGPYIRSIGSDPEAARRAGVPVRCVTWSVYVLCGAFAGFGGFISLSQTRGGVRCLWPECRVPRNRGCRARWHELVRRPRNGLGPRHRRHTHHYRAEWAGNGQRECLRLPDRYGWGDLHRRPHRHGPITSC
jgi:ribose/xylose/arabinose/galactoside ABC-type transport system permease subunit